MKILIFGASGSGTTTLGSEIERTTGFVHLDVDDFYWKQTEPPFQEKVPLDKRNENLRAVYLQHDNVVVSGSLVSWGTEWRSSFDLTVFMYLNNEERMERLRKRELERYGKQLQSNRIVAENSTAFLEWANQYEQPNFEGRSLRIHTEWIELLECKVITIDGAWDLDKKTSLVITEIESLGIC